MDEYKISEKMVDEVITTGKPYFDPMHNSNVYLKSVADMQTGRPVGGRFLLVAENPITGRIINTYPKSNIPSRLVPMFKP